MPVPNRIALLLTMIFSTLMLSGVCEAKSRDMNVVSDVDLEQYCGTWYEIARLPNNNEKNLVDVTSTFEKKNDGGYELINRGYKGSHNGKCVTLKGNIVIPDSSRTGDLKMKVLVFSIGYKIIDVDKDRYRFALVTSDNSRKFLWILSKSPNMEKGVYDRLVESAREKGFSVEKLEKVQQNSNDIIAEN